MRSPDENLKAFVTFSFITLLSLVLFLMDVLNLFSWLEYIQKLTYQPFAYTFYKLDKKINNTWLSIKDASRLRQENIENQAKILELESQLNDCREKFKSIEFINKQISATPDYNFIDALIVDSHYGTQNGYILIDKGAKNGIKMGNLVIFNNSLVGQIEKLYPYLSVVKTIYAPDYTQLIYISPSKTSGLLTVKNQELFIDDILITEKIKKNQEVYILKNDIPLKIRIGKIEDISTELTGAKHKVKVKPDININQIDNVAVLIGT